MRLDQDARLLLLRFLQRLTRFDRLSGSRFEIVRFSEEATLPSIHLPTTVVAGDHDLMTPLRQAEYMAERIPGAELQVLPGCGHMVMLERPDQLNRIIARCVAEVDRTLAREGG